ncbi:MAG: type III-B CRISPR module RAMP protein Cmr4 [Anaerolineae bacterium]|nr:type III-B CRISPR module RAMP protein Cmr4 [Anaerolineae bacterium]
MRPEVLRYFALALDPIHVGTGGMRLGRVDMSIVREPGTNLPKIPGTSLAGACRTYAAMQENRYRWESDGKTYVCAGQGQEDKDKNIVGHCGRPDCPICVTFGFSKGSGASFQGLAQFSDARLVLFPVHSLAGPVWVTCPMVLKDLGISSAEPNDGEVQVADGLKHIDRINLGWLMLDVVSNGFSLDASKLPGVPEEILNRAVLVSDRMFGHIVNDNLEVRTSVSIDPRTGAAAEGALFTYEAIPRASVLYFEVVVGDPKYYRIAKTVEQNGEKKTVYVIPLNNDVHKEGNVKTVVDTVQKGLELFESLGIGGMNTRGMGRLRVINLNAGGGRHEQGES